MPSQLNFDFGGARSVHVQVLGSSSGGNCTAFWTDEGALLVDIGFGPRTIERRLKDEGLAVRDVAGVLITHTHTDHVHEYTLEMMAGHEVPLLCPPGVAKVLARRSPAGRRLHDRGLLRQLKGLQALVGPFGVEAFPVPHDAPGGCFGYSIWSGDAKITIATDLGYPENGLVERFAGSRVIIIESNHDPDMLERSGRPAWLKRRIRERGHLSNSQCAGLVSDILDASEEPPQAVLVAHISQECNTNELAVGCTRDVISARGYAGVPVFETFADRAAGKVGVTLR